MLTVTEESMIVVEVLIISEVRGCVQTELQIDGMGLFVTRVKFSDVDATCSLA